MVRPDNSLQLTRLACGKSAVSCPPSCARMSGPFPEPPGGCPSQARGPTGMLRDAARIPSGDASRSSRPLGGSFPVTESTDSALRPEEQGEE